MIKKMIVGASIVMIAFLIEIILLPKIYIIADIIAIALAVFGFWLYKTNSILLDKKYTIK